MTRPQPEQERERAQSDAEKDAGDGRDWLQHLPIAILVLTTLIMVGAYFFGERLLGISGQDGVAGVFEGFRQSPLAPFVVVLVFTGLGLTGFPQFLLIAGTVAIFGPVAGFFYSWTATMVSSGVGFFLGHLSGARLLRRWGGQTVNRASEIIGRHGILATIIVRLVPSGPFVMVNLVAGMSHITYAQFALGTGLGIVPKTALIAFVGGQLMDFVREQDPWELALVVLVLILWGLAGVWVRRRFLAHARASSEQPGTEKPEENEGPSVPGAAKPAPSPALGTGPGSGEKPQ